MSEPAAETVVDPEGRVMIAPSVRRKAGLDVGDAVIVHVGDGRVVIETRDQLAERTRRDVAHPAAGGSPVEELLAERRAAAAREQAG